MGLPCSRVDDGEKMSQLAGGMESSAAVSHKIGPVESTEIQDDEEAACSSGNNYSRPTAEFGIDDEQATSNSGSCDNAWGSFDGKEMLQISTLEISQELESPGTISGDVVLVVKCTPNANPSLRQKLADMKLKVFKKPKRKEVTVTTTTQVPFYKLFMFADWWDHILIAVGTTGACVHGVAVPVFFLFFGDLIDSFGANYNDPDKMGNEVSKVLAHLFH